MEPAEYCRAIETYLCQKNGGHLIRIVGPVFEQVCRWAEQGVPLKVAFRGIDEYCERYYAKGPRRRPVRIEFCEADVLERFDAWRRAVGIREPASPASRRPALTEHLDRLLIRLTALRAGGSASAEVDEALDRAVREIDAMRSPAREARGAARTTLIERLASLDRELIAMFRRTLSEHDLEELAREAVQELAPFLSRMPDSGQPQAIDACLDRLVRDRVKLPVVAFE